MKVLILTESLDVKNGWGRYSNDFIYGLKKNGVEAEIILNKKDEKDNHKVLLPNPLSWKKNYFLFIFYAIKIYFKVRNKKIDIIHSHIETYAPIAMFLAFLCRKKYFLTLHGTYAVKPYSINFFVRFAHYLCYLRACQLIAISEYTKEKTIKYFPKCKNKISVIRNGIKIKKNNNKFDKNSKNKIILTVAPLKERKGVLNVALAMAKVMKKNLSVNWVVVGTQQDKKYADRVRLVLEEHHLLDRCTFLSNLAEGDLLEIYNKSYIFVLTPQSTDFEFEGFGLVYLEANHFGLPTIGAYNCGAESSVNENVGCLVKYGDIDMLADKMELLIKDSNLYRDKSERAKLWAGKHSIELLVGDYISIFKKYGE